eukprot:6200707-Pleurochrysis_carterae.AAC.6
MCACTNSVPGESCRRHEDRRSGQASTIERRAPAESRAEQCRQLGSGANLTKASQLCERGARWVGNATVMLPAMVSRLLLRPALRELLRSFELGLQRRTRPRDIPVCMRV